MQLTVAFCQIKKKKNNKNKLNSRVYGSLISVLHTSFFSLIEFDQAENLLRGERYELEIRQSSY